MPYGGYSGRCNCSVSIDRYKDLDTGKYYTESEAEEIDLEEKFVYEEIDLDVEGGAYYTPGFLSGRPEDCYPDESDVEIISITDSDGNDWGSKLTNSEIDMVESTIIDNVKDPY